MKISDDMTREEEFEKWWGSTQTKYYWRDEIAKQVWNAAWCAAKLGQWEATKAEAVSEIKAKYRADAAKAFLDGDDDEAFLLRRLANAVDIAL